MVECTEAYPRWKPLALVYNPHLEGTISRALADARASVAFLAYCLDERVLVEGLSSACRRLSTFTVRVVLDKEKFLVPACSRQGDCLLTLIEWGVVMRVRRPFNRFASAQHEKTWLIDQQLYLCGSANGTHNSLHNCEEALLATTVSDVVREATAHF